jgi:hypothetical protein
VWIPSIKEKMAMVMMIMMMIMMMMIIIIIIMWIQWVHTDGEVTANRPDVITKNEREKTCILVDAAEPADRNFSRRNR